jgi:MYXO-CTERM domain-containing protein
MSTNGSTPGSASAKTPEQIEADIARQREQLASTVNELQAKLDVKTRAQAKVAELKGRATTADGKPTPPAIGATAAAVLAIVGLVLLRRRRHR